jgi:hypothetical protein
MSAILETAPLAARRDRSAEARNAARLARARRERRIVDLLNCGRSVAEIAERENVTEKRMRALVQEILARRMPQPRAEFLAQQVSRLHEALLVSYSAMSGDNLQAVDRVVKIVRELDRYHGYASSARRSRADALNLEAPAPPRRLGTLVTVRLEKAPRSIENLSFAPEDGRAMGGSNLQGVVEGPDGAFAAAPAAPNRTLSPSHR